MNQIWLIIYLNVYFNMPNLIPIYIIVIRYDRISEWRFFSNNNFP